jgi:hypothetical protein
MNVHQNLNPYFSPLLPHGKSVNIFLLCQAQTALFHKCAIGTLYGALRKVPSFCLSETTILVWRHGGTITFSPVFGFFCPGSGPLQILDYNYPNPAVPCH